QIGIARDGSHARIGNDQTPTTVAASPDVVGCNRGALANIGTNDKQDFSLRNFAPGNRAAVDAECQLVCSSGRNHAESAVVIDMPSSHGHTSKLAQEIRFLGGERCASVNRESILAVLALNLTNTVYSEIEAFIPACSPKTIGAAHH